MHNIPCVVFIWVKLCIYIYTYEQHFLSNISHTDILSNIHEKQLHYIYIYIQMIGSILFVDVNAADNAPNL